MAAKKKSGWGAGETRYGAIKLKQDLKDKSDKDKLAAAAKLKKEHGNKKIMGVKRKTAKKVVTVVKAAGAIAKILKKIKPKKKKNMGGSFGGGGPFGF
jgi:hypothetical protein